MKDVAVRVLITGGTLDKVYDRVSGELAFSSTHVQEIFQQSGCHSRYIVEKVMLKDSLFFTDEDRKRVLEFCRKSPENRILITHGTDTMVQTASVLGENITDRTIVLTGAMAPATVEKSDALFNLGFAYCCAKTLEHGVYIAMNGNIFDWRNVRKNKDKALFEKIIKN
jgi:L-asparaginase